MIFSPIILPSLIIEPLRYFFSTYGAPNKLVWDVDEKKRTVDIGHLNDYFKIALEERPRILVDRGGFRISGVGITDSMAEQKTMAETRGLKDRVSMAMYSGVATVLIEARNMGTCEQLSDMTCHFLNMVRPKILDVQKFKDFGRDMTVSSCQPTEKENTEKFQIQIQIPWTKEEHWRTRDDGIAVKDILMKVTV